ncbi:hypothetical protein [Amycolatopsis taiwanensis]|uniref:Cupin domain-containing protein n=1 Tax=Amycolatopsis taiwanensis TaxID=342230 RepID=A0A9W6VE62_9PSEU|nr:hypothetical protein [Amycolatopsis taiwanensis]GLY64162.1 hypothetical protein Atai01_07810 [Amycolatopsis taiwanensis]
MSLLNADGSPVLLTRASDAEMIDVGATKMALLADADTSGGVINANRARIAPGSAGAPPHFHASSAEIFFVLGGSLRALAGDRVVTLDSQDRFDNHFIDSPHWPPSGP